MVTPSQKRVAVAQLVAEFGVSERRACLVVNQHCSTQRHCTTRSDEERAIRHFVTLTLTAVVVRDQDFTGT